MEWQSICLKRCAAAKVLILLSAGFLCFSLKTFGINDLINFGNLNAKRFAICLMYNDSK